MSDHDELKMQQCARVCSLSIDESAKLFSDLPACFIEVENSEIYRATGTKSAVRGCFPFL
jgi:hypothetical protein